MPTATEMFNELIRLGYIIPKTSNYADLTMPSMYRCVPTITTAGTGAEPSGSVVDAKLERGSQGDQGN